VLERLSDARFPIEGQPYITLNMVAATVRKNPAVFMLANYAYRVFNSVYVSLRLNSELCDCHTARYESVVQTLCC
jgi:hypothetical protein